MSLLGLPGPGDGEFLCERFACFISARACIGRQDAQAEKPGKYPPCTADCSQGGAVAAAVVFFVEHPLASMQLIEERRERRATVEDDELRRGTGG